MGVVFSDEKDEKKMKYRANRIKDLTVGRYLLDGPANSEREIKKALELKGTETKFHEVFRELYASAESGNDKDGQLLIDLMESSFWNTLSYSSVYAMKKML
jgi:hypothetical protein